MKKYVLNAIIGMGFGFPITLLCMTLIGGYNAVVGEFWVWMAASALYGLLSTVLDSEKFDLPLPVSIGLHALGCIVITVCAALLCGYIKSVADVLSILVPACIIYVVVCLICFLLMKQNEKNINKALDAE
ncbi:MAG: DUF3021 domain-containing protein [Oscillospiraceae bacterium]|nr:DUF3021 domain-containing protein [Oscillospiraceae bacterium]